jgi:hypothetical protein
MAFFILSGRGFIGLTVRWESNGGGWPTQPEGVYRAVVGNELFGLDAEELGYAGHIIFVWYGSCSRQKFQLSLTVQLLFTMSNSSGSLRRSNLRHL